MTRQVAYPEKYGAAADKPPPAPIVPGPVQPVGTNAIDGAQTAFGDVTNADLGPTNAAIAGDDADRRARAAAAARKFPAQDAEGAQQMQGVGAQQATQMVEQLASGLAGAISGAIGGITKPLTELPQQAMQAAQGAMQPLMSALQQGHGAAGLASDDHLVDSLGAEPGLGGGAGGGGAGGIGAGGGTTPAGYLGPPPVPSSSPPTTPAGAPAKSASVTPTGATPPVAGPMGASGMPMVPPGAHGPDGAGEKAKPVEKRVSAPGVPNGQPVKGRLTPPPSAPVSKSAEGKPVVRRRILLPGLTEYERSVSDEKPDGGE